MSVVLVGWMVMLAAAGAPPMQAVSLKVAGRVVSAVPADVDGDGQNDVLVFWRQGLPPESRSRVSVFLARNGRIRPKPVQVLRLPRKCVGFDQGDVNADGRTDVLWISGDGIWAHLAGTDGRLAKEPVRVIEVMTLAAYPHEDHVPPMPLLVELDARGRTGILIPTVPIGPLALYEYGRAKGWFLRQVLRVPTRANLHTSAEDFRSARDFGTTFRLTYPRRVVADQNGDGHPDLLFFSRDTVAVFRGRADGSFPKRPDLHRGFGLITPEERTRRGLLVRGGAGDVNGDGRADLFFNKTVGGISNMKCELRVYLTGPSGEFAGKPAFNDRREGWGLSARLTDVNGDGRADLLRPHVEMGLTTLIKAMLAGKLDVAFEVYLARESGLSRRPDLVVRSGLGINFQSAQELHGPSPLFGEDFNGDGLPDMVSGHTGDGSGDNPDRLTIRAGKTDGRFSADPLWGIDYHSTRFVAPFRIRKKDPPGLLVWFSLVDRLRGDVWVLHNTGNWR